MTEELTLEILERELRLLLGVTDIRLTADSKATDVQGWDSLNHVRLIIQLESVTGKKVSLRKTTRAANVGELIQLYR